MYWGWSLSLCLPYYKEAYSTLLPNEQFNTLTECSTRSSIQDWNDPICKSGVEPRTLFSIGAWSFSGPLHKMDTPWPTDTCIKLPTGLGLTQKCCHQSSLFVNPASMVYICSDMAFAVPQDIAMVRVTGALKGILVSSIYHYSPTFPCSTHCHHLILFHCLNFFFYDLWFWCLRKADKNGVYISGLWNMESNFSRVHSLWRRCVIERWTSSSSAWEDECELKNLALVELCLSCGIISTLVGEGCGGFWICSVEFWVSVATL